MLPPRIASIPFLCSLWKQNLSKKVAYTYLSSNFLLKPIHLILYLHFTTSTQTFLSSSLVTSNISKTSGQFSVLILSNLSAEVLSFPSPSSSVSFRLTYLKVTFLDINSYRIEMSYGSTVCVCVCACTHLCVCV